jgi:hypothetical protein
VHHVLQFLLPELPQLETFTSKISVSNSPHLHRALGTRYYKWYLTVWLIFKENKSASRYRSSSPRQHGGFLHRNSRLCSYSECIPPILSLIPRTSFFISIYFRIALIEVRDGFGVHSPHLPTGQSRPPCQSIQFWYSNKSPICIIRWYGFEGGILDTAMDSIESFIGKGNKPQGN